MIPTCIDRLGQNSTYAPYMTVCLVIPLPKIPCIQCIYVNQATPNYIRKEGVLVGLQ
jgi:hypothetical protein